MLSQDFYVIIYCGISAPGHVREVVYGLNVIDKRFILQLMSNVQLSGTEIYDTQMVIHTITRTSDSSLAKEFQKTCLMRHTNME